MTMKNPAGTHFSSVVFLDAQTIKYTIACAIAILCSFAGIAQINLIPTSDGGFENATVTLAANGWTAANATGSAWVCGSGATPYAGTNSGYIASSGTTYGYTNALAGQTRVSHLYRNVTIPAGVTGLTLSFQLKSGGEVGQDRLFVSTAPTSVTPTTSSTTGYVTQITGATLVYVQPVLIPTYSLVSIHLPNSVAGTTLRIIFSWMNDGATQTNPNPSSIDDVSLTYWPVPPAAGACGYSFAATGAVHTYSVPIGCSALAIDAWGGAGGTCHYQSSNNTSWNLGGLGGRTQATVNVTPSTTSTATVLQVTTGGKGGNATSAGAGAGGYNGGGKGSDYNANLNGGGGGGASDVRVSPYGLADRLVVAGGGGGGGFNSGGGRQDERGGNGGGTTGEAGYEGGTFDAVQAGQPGTPTAGGAKATGSGVGNDGALGTGGAGTSTASTATGGGGGGGYYGGGSGFFGGGGGGSSYAVPGATAVTHTQGITPYNGIVYITPVAPTIFTVTTTGGGGCPGPAPTVGLNGSQTDVNYQLYLGGTAVGSPVTGTGSAISFGSVATTGTYTVAAYYTGYNGCLTVMAGSSVVTTTGPDVSSLATAASSPCLGSASTVTITSSTLVSGTAYTVDYTLSGANTGTHSASMAFGTGSGTFTIAAVDLPNPGATTITINTITITSTGCSSTPGSGNVANFTVRQAPGAISGVVSGLCTGSTTTLSNPVAGGTWSSSNTAVATVNTSGDVGGVGAGTATITYSTGCGADATQTVSIAAGGSTISGASSVCEGATTPLSIAATGGTWSSSSTAIATVDVSGGVTGVGAGAVTISYSAGCVSTWPMTVIAAPGAITGITSGICTSGTTTLSNPVAGGTWSSGTPSVATVHTTSGVVTGISAGSTVITYSTGCGADATTTVTISASGGVISGAASVCVGAGTPLSIAATGGTWSSSNTAIATVDASGVVTGVGAGAVTITYSAGCLATWPMTIDALPGAITGVTSGICTSGTTALSNPVAGGTWSSGTPAVAAVNATTGVVTGVSAGSAVITYSTGCGDATTTVTISAGGGTISGATSICVGSNTALSIAATGGTWSSSNTTIATVDASGVVTGAGAGSVTISYSSGCTSTHAFTVVAAPGPITGGSIVCVGATLALNNTVAGGTWSGSNPGVAAISTTGVATGVASGTATISYTTGCGTDATLAFTVNAIPTVAAISGTTTVCVGGNIQLTDATPGGTWTSSAAGTATVSNTGAVSGVAAGAVAISYSVTNSCGTTNVTYNVTVDAANGGTITGADSVCKGAAHKVTLTASVAGGAWTSSNTARAVIDATTGEVTGISTGAFTITYVVANTCGTFTVTHAMYVRSPSRCATGIAVNQQDGTELKVFPNPNDGTFTLTLLSGNAEEATVTISNVLGATVRSFTIPTNKAADVTLHVAPGVYLLSVSVGDERYNSRVVVSGK